MKTARCRGCGRRFTVKIGHAGHYCSRACYTNPYRANRGKTRLVARIKASNPSGWADRIARNPDPGSTTVPAERIVRLGSRAPTREFLQAAALARRGRP